MIAFSMLGFNLVAGAVVAALLLLIVWLTR